MAQRTEAASADVGQAVRRLGHELVSSVAGKLSEGVDFLIDTLNNSAQDAGATAGAAVAAGEASLVGKSPVWAAIKGGWSAASTKTKILIVLGLILAVLLLPVALVVLLLGLGYLGIRAAISNHSSALA